MHVEPSWAIPFDAGTPGALHSFSGYHRYASPYSGDSILRDFTTDVAGWFFLAGALMLWGGWVLLPHRVGMFFQSDDFPAIGARLQLWVRVRAGVSCWEGSRALARCGGAVRAVSGASGPRRRRPGVAGAGGVRVAPRGQALAAEQAHGQHRHPQAAEDDGLAG